MFLGIAAILGFLAVAMGAFGAHGLKGWLSELPDFQLRMSWWEKAVHYHMWHALLLVLVSVIAQHSPHKMLQTSSIAILIGIVIFSGSLYTMTLTNLRVLGAITPIGGLSLLFGWGLLAFWAFTQN
ncbi:MAG: hypothetical protein CMH56_00655 [Myxococcales bacterium]|nr:hypothetical protein [Myxococcales bacterium]|tara:strand:- start:5601 stop:5978 length:378 start_codon:yes stop_codon:yes gene_type:complete